MLLKTNKDIIFIIVIFVLLVISAASLFGGWKYINQLQAERDLLKADNKELLKEKEEITRSLQKREKQFERITNEKTFLKNKIIKKEKELEKINYEYEKELNAIANADVNDDFSNVSDIFSSHSRR